MGTRLARQPQGAPAEVHHKAIQRSRRARDCEDDYLSHIFLYSMFIQRVHSIAQVVPDALTQHKTPPAGGAKENVSSTLCCGWSKRRELTRLLDARWGSKWQFELLPGA